jgi:hypothetical protein
MTLKEKFYTIATNVEISNGHLISKVPKIADEFAIGFADWLAKWGNVSLENGNWIINLRLKASTTKEALEIYKKEKGL